jgi:hypothetical protein
VQLPTADHVPLNAVVENPGPETTPAMSKVNASVQAVSVQEGVDRTRFDTSVARNVKSPTV